MILDLRYIKSTKELKDIIIQYKEDDEFRMNLIDNLVDGEIQQWLTTCFDVDSAMMVGKLNAIDYSLSDTEILQSVYDIFQINSDVDPPDLSSNFVLMGLRLDGRDIVKDEIIIKDDLQHKISAVVKVTRPVNEKLELTLLLKKYRQKENNNPNPIKGEKPPSPNDLSKILSPEDLNKLQFLLNNNNGKSKFPNSLPSPMMPLLSSGVPPIVADTIKKALESSKTGEEKDKVMACIAAVTLGLMVKGIMDSSVKRLPLFPQFSRQEYEAELYLNVATNTLLEVAFPLINLEKGELKIKYKHLTLIEIPINN